MHSSDFLFSPWWLSDSRLTFLRCLGFPRLGLPVQSPTTRLLGDRAFQASHPRASDHNTVPMRMSRIVLCSCQSSGLVHDLPSRSPCRKSKLLAYPAIRSYIHIPLFGAYFYSQRLRSKTMLVSVRPSLS